MYPDMLEQTRKPNPIQIPTVDGQGHWCTPIILSLVLLLLTSCTTSSKNVVALPPVPVSSADISQRVQQPTSALDTQDQVPAIAQDDPVLNAPRVAPRRSSQTVIALLDQASDQEAAGRNERAAAVLERALRIEPRNPLLWHRLAKLRYKQGQLTLAESLAAKSSALARDDWQLKEQNNLLIQQVRQKRAGR